MGDKLPELLILSRNTSRHRKKIYTAETDEKSTTKNVVFRRFFNSKQERPCLFVAFSVFNQYFLSMENSPETL